MYKTLLLELMEELNAQDILNDLFIHSLEPKFEQIWREANPRTGTELYEVMMEQFTSDELIIITRDLDFDL